MGKGNREVDMKFFEASNKKTTHKVWKDGQDKHEMKETIKSMAHYINVILHPEEKPILEMLVIFYVSYVTNQQSLDNLHKCKVVAKTIGECMQGILDDTMKHIGLLDKDSKEISTITKNIELSNGGYEKERNNWEKVVIWLDDIQEFRL